MLCSYGHAGRHNTFCILNYLMDAKIETIETKIFSEVVADEIVASIGEAISERGRCSVSLAGGGTPGSVYRLLARPPRVSEIDWSKVSFYWGDERWVPNTNTQSNFKMVQETLLSHIPAPGPTVYPVDTSLKSPEDGARAYGDLVCEVEQTKPGEIPQLDIVLLGIGEDGHTASLFPGTSVVTAKGKMAYALKHPTDGSSRVTLSSEVLFSGKKIFFIVNGDTKAAMMKRVLKGSDPVEVIPARLYLGARGQVTFFLDSGAATQL